MEVIYAPVVVEMKLETSLKSAWVSEMYLMLLVSITVVPSVVVSFFTYTVSTLAGIGFTTTGVAILVYSFQR